jgi:hypothetical protein
MFKILDRTLGNLIAIEVDGHIQKKDYDKITPLIEKSVKEYGKIRLYIQITKIEGVEPKAFIEDVKTYFKHFKHMEKIAVVGENKWQKFWSDLAAPFVSGELKYFSHEQIAAAQTWIEI